MQEMAFMSQQLRMRCMNVVEDKHVSIYWPSTQDVSCDYHGLQRIVSQQVAETHTIGYPDCRR
jgi:hypothetical protein